MSRFAAFALVLLLAACGPAMVTADVTRFSQSPAAATPHRFTILPDAGQTGSLEFQHYAELVANQLVGRGWTPVPASGDADAVVTLHWGLGPPQTITWEEPAILYGGAGPWYDGGLAGPFPYWDSYSETTWAKWLAVTILDGPAWRRHEKQPFFEGRAVTQGSLPVVNPALPALVTALFTGFPGANGRTIEVTVPLEPKT